MSTLQIPNLEVLTVNHCFGGKVRKMDLSCSIVCMKLSVGRDTRQVTKHEINGCHYRSGCSVRNGLVTFFSAALGSILNSVVSE